MQTPEKTQCVSFLIIMCYFPVIIASWESFIHGFFDIQLWCRAAALCLCGLFLCHLTHNTCVLVLNGCCMLTFVVKKSCYVYHVYVYTEYKYGICVEYHINVYNKRMEHNIII